MSAPMEGEVVVAGFTVVPVKFNKDSEASQYLYIKEHSVRDTNPCKPRDRTLFVLNVPPYCTEACLERLFSEFGKIQNVFIHKKPTSAAPPSEESKFFKASEPVTGYKVAYVVFKHASSVQKAKATSFDHPKILSTEDHPILTGFTKWCHQYQEQMPDVKELQKEIDKYMQDYDNKVEEEKQKEKDMEGMPDEEGWVTVTRHGKNKGIPRTEAQEKKITAKEKKRRKEKELLNFYTFQMRESKREHIAQLRQKFEEDKQRIAQMKEARKFRPY